MEHPLHPSPISLSLSLSPPFSLFCIDRPSPDGNQDGGSNVYKRRRISGEGGGFLLSQLLSVSVFVDVHKSVRVSVPTSFLFEFVVLVWAGDRESCFRISVRISVQ